MSEKPFARPTNQQAPHERDGVRAFLRLLARAVVRDLKAEDSRSKSAAKGNVRLPRTLLKTPSQEGVGQ